jgi:hypothetical protein
VEDRGQVIGGPLLADLSVPEPVHIDRVPAHPAARRRDPEQLAQMCRLDDESHYDRALVGDDVLLLRVQVRQRADETLQQSDEALNAFYGAESPAVPLDIRGDVLGRQLGVVRVENSLAVLTNDLDVRLDCCAACDGVLPS